jgi:acyl-CoA thioester hydrolase
MTMHPALADYKVVIALPVQWGEQDLYGHVNNIIYFRWFESARVAYGERLDFARLFREQKLGPILASVRCDFRQQVSYPATALIGARITRLGNSSLTMTHAVAVEGREGLVAEGDSTVVFFDYAAQKSTRIPDDLRAKIRAIEGLPLA